MLLALAALIAPAGAQAQSCADREPQADAGPISSSGPRAPCCACTTRSAPATASRRCARTRSCAGPPARHSSPTWSARTSSTTPPPAARRWSTASAAPARPPAPARGRSARTSPGAPAALATAAQIHRRLDEVLGPSREHHPSLVPRDRDRHRDRLCPCGSPPRNPAPRTPQTSATAIEPRESAGHRAAGGVVSLRRPVADVQPLNALHYALDRVGGLPPVVAPPVRRHRPRAARLAWPRARRTTWSRSTCP